MMVLQQDRQALFLRLKLPVTRNLKGIRAIYAHLPEPGRVAFDVSLKVLGDASMQEPSKAEHSSPVIFKVDSSRATWLVATAPNQSGSGREDASQTEAAIFISCAQEACTSSILPAVELAMGALTTHPVRGIVVSARTSSPSSIFFTHLLGKEHSFVFTTESHFSGTTKSRRQSAIAGQNHSGCVRTNTFNKWQLRICAGGTLSSTEPHLLRHTSWYSASARFPATSPPFELTVQEARNISGFDSIHYKPDSLIEDNTSMVAFDIQVNTSGRVLIQLCSFELDFGSVQNQGGDNLKAIDLSFAILKIMQGLDGMVFWDLIGIVHRQLRQSKDALFLQSRIETLWRGVSILDWSNTIQGEVTSSNVSINYKLNGRDVFGSSNFDLLFLNYTTLLQLGSGAGRKDLQAGGYLSWNSKSEHIHSCSVRSCYSNVHRQYCEDPNYTSRCCLDLIAGWPMEQHCCIPEAPTGLIPDVVTCVA
eukprot:767554-Hanusia_phi.AAC.9